MTSPDRIIKQLRSKQHVEVIVRPGAHKTELDSYDQSHNILYVRISEPAQKNKANTELISFLSKLLCRQMTIKHGSTSKRKLLTFLD